MACFKPLNGFRAYGGGISFSHIDSTGIPMTVPCGQCIGCRLARSLEWATRITHEAKMHEYNSFITLTYNDAFIPADLSLNKKHFQDFIKRLRKKLSPKKIRYFHCGEYGAKFSRPHYHACIFGYSFPDRKYFKAINGVPLFTSEELQNLWSIKGDPIGFVTVGDVTFQSAAYVARYILKKVNGKQAEDHYEAINKYTGEVLPNPLQPEYISMSLKPGIGSTYYQKYKITDGIFHFDEVIIGGKSLKPPRFYQKIYQHEEPQLYEELKSKRIKNNKKHKKDQTPERLAAREKCQISKLPLLKRSYEDDEDDS